jgi:hypothetical protein
VIGSAKSAAIKKQRMISVEVLLRFTGFQLIENQPATGV